MKFIYITFLCILPIFANANSDIQLDFEKIQYEILNNNNIGKLEINYIYTEMLSISESLNGYSPDIDSIRFDFDFLFGYINELFDNNELSYSNDDIWLYIIENPKEAEDLLLSTMKEIKP